MNSPYQLLIFDYDGTICKTDDTIIYAFGRTFEHFKLAMPSEDKIREGISSGATLIDFLPFLRPELKDSTEELQNWVHTYRKIYSSDAEPITTLFEGAHETIHKIKDQNICCVVISNKGQQAIEKSLHRFDLYSYFDLIIGDDPKHTLPKKPDPQVYHQEIHPRYSHIPTDKVLMIGDTDVDLVFANNAGINSCWAAYGFGSPEKCIAANPTYTINSLQELNKVLALA